MFFFEMDSWYKWFLNVNNDSQSYHVLIGDLVFIGKAYFMDLTVSLINLTIDSL